MTTRSGSRRLVRSIFSGNIEHSAWTLHKITHGWRVIWINPLSGLKHEIFGFCSSRKKAEVMANSSKDLPKFHPNRFHDEGVDHWKQRIAMQGAFMELVQASKTVEIVHAEDITEAFHNERKNTN